MPTEPCAESVVDGVQQRELLRSNTAESVDPVGITVPWYRRRAPRVGLAALLAILLAILLLGGGSTSREERATRAAPKMTARSLRIAGQRLTQLPPLSIDSRSFTLPVLGADPNGGAGQGSGDPFTFLSSLPRDLSAPAPAPAYAPVPNEIPATRGVTGKP